MWPLVVVGPPCAQGADIGHEEFQKAERAALAGSGDERGQGKGSSNQRELVHEDPCASGDTPRERLKFDTRPLLYLCFQKSLGEIFQQVNGEAAGC